MSFASKYNNARKFDFNTTGFSYTSLVDLYNQNGKDYVYPLRAIYINTKGKYADAPVFATDDVLVNIPSHMTETAKEIMADDDAVSAINAGKAGFKIYSYHDNKHNKNCFSIDFVDID